MDAQPRDQAESLCPARISPIIVPAPHFFSKSLSYGNLLSHLRELTAMARYRHSPLPKSTGVIRLLRLLPSAARHEPLRCELFEYTIDVASRVTAPYEAVSYVWGDEADPRSIIVEDEELLITRNLWEALTELRDCMFTRLFWIDAVCINQKDEAEKEHQIRFMVAIYAKASRVIVWLGTAHDGGDYALKSIRAAACEAGRPPAMNKVDHSVTKLLQRPWFRRI